MADNEKDANERENLEEVSADSATPVEDETEQPAEIEAEETNEAESAEASDAPVKRNQTVAPVKKAKPTPKRKDAKAPVETKRTTPVLFVKQSIGELKQVKWPTATQVRQYFWVVLVFVLFIMTYVAGLDHIFGWIALKLLG